MSASQWSYLLDFDDDVERAFQRLQARVFERGEYYAYEATTRPRSIAALRAAQAEEGTHSILDMHRVTRDAAPPRPTEAEAGQRLLAAILGGPAAATPNGTVFRMTDDELRTVFGTTRPSQPPATCALAIERGTGRYAVLYDGDRPRALWFVGVSGC